MEFDPLAQHFMLIIVFEWIFAEDDFKNNHYVLCQIVKWRLKAYPSSIKVAVDTKESNCFFLKLKDLIF